ncbi:hypothetical protein ACFSQQ_19725 [Mesorhizobium kowhaii]|uniref:hypothetical protein n=1 Tax=Mesorhizobium kowhaii TaxID=1300272 RepID=UPI0035E6F567
MTNLDLSRQILAHDIDPEFLQSVAVDLAWEYHLLYEDLRANRALPVEMKLEQFADRRGSCAVNALVRSCQKHGVPYNFRALECNGQQKLIVKIGRVVLIQEPMLELSEKPRVSDYKRDLADTHSLIRQLELNLGDQPSRILDWSGDILAVLLHGAAGSRFKREHLALGGLLLAVPDASYSMWVMRLDLHRVAMFGLGNADITPDPTMEINGNVQRDRVVAKLKRNKRNAGFKA